MLNSCLGLFSATYFRRHPFSRSYGVNLPSSLTAILPMVLGFSPHLPVSVYGTSTFTLDSGFSRQCGISCFGTCFPSASGLRNIWRIFLPDYLLPLHDIFLCVAQLILLRPHLSITSNGSTGISTSCPSPTPLGLGLGPDLPWADEPSPGILRFSADKILTCLFAYSYRHSHF